MIKKIPPILLILGSYITLIILGAILLYLPISYQDNAWHFSDAFFTAASSVFLSGMTTVDIAVSLTIFGQVVVLLLMQVSAFGIILITIGIFYLLGLKINFITRNLASNAVGTQKNKGIIKIVLHIFVFTFIIQLIGFLLYLIIFIPNVDSLGDAIFYSLFTSVSAFSNTGFNIIPPDISSSLNYFNNNVLYLIITGFLVILGGIGIFVIDDLILVRNPKKWQPHTKVVLKMTGILLILGALIIWISELHNDNVSFLTALFLSITSRTAGISVIPITTLTSPSLVIICTLMVIGGAPSSNAGGIKVTTLYVLLKSITGYLKNKPAMTNKKIIGSDSKQKAYVLVVLSAIVVLIGIFLIGIIESLLNNNLVGDGYYGLGIIIFEVLSAFSTSGYSTGLTQFLNFGSLIILIILMMFGRLGPIALLSVFGKYKKIEYKKDTVAYLEEKIVIG